MGHHNIPPDVWGEIFFRMPMKKLIPARAVCKSWRSLIDDPYLRLRVLSFQLNSMIPNTLLLEEGLEHIQRGVDKLIFNLEEFPRELKFSSEEYMSLYSTAYNMCTRKQTHDFSGQLYDKYREVLEQYITSTVLPCLRNLQGELLLRELVKRWQNHKLMVRWFCLVFLHLDRYFLPRMSLPSLKEFALTCFRDLVFQETNGKARDAVSAMFVLEREGKQIDRDLLKNVSDIFFEFGQKVLLEDSSSNMEIATDRMSPGPIE